MMSENAVIYARYSSHGQQEQSIEGQLAAGHEYADRKGYVIIGEYCDRAKTGTNDNRAEFQKMLSDCAKRKFTVIIVWKVDRFGRNREEIMANKIRAKRYGVRVEYVAENISPGPEGVILESVLEGMAEYYSLQLSQNVKRGHLESAKKRQAVGGRPSFGLRIGKDKHYEIDPVTGPVVRQIFERYAAGESMAEITRWLNESGYRTSKGRPFTKNSLPRILHNERYAGTYIFGDTIREENCIPAIISMGLFRRVQEMLKANKRMPSHSWSYSEYILTGKLFCGHCGAPMVGKSGNGKSGTKYNYYACQNHLQKAGCHKRAVRQEWIEDIVLTNVTITLQDDEIMERIIDTVWDLYTQEDQTRDELRAIQTQIRAADKAIDNLMRSLELGLVSETIVNRIKDLEAQRADLQKAAAEKELAQSFKLTKDQVRFFLERYRRMDMQDRECQRRLVETFVNAVYVSDDKIRIVFNYSDSETGQNETVTFDDLGSLMEPKCSNVTANIGVCTQGANISSVGSAPMRHCVLLTARTRRPVWIVDINI